MPPSDALPPPGSTSRRYKQPYCNDEAEELSLYPPEYDDAKAFNRDHAPWGPGLDKPGDSARDPAGLLLPLNSRRHLPSSRRGHGPPNQPSLGWYSAPWPAHNGPNMGLPRHERINLPAPAAGMSMSYMFPTPPPVEPPPVQPRHHYLHGNGERYNSHPRRFQEPVRRRKRSRSTPGGARISDSQTRILSDSKKSVDHFRGEQMYMKNDIQIISAEAKMERQRREERDRRIEDRLRDVEEAQRREDKLTMGLDTRIRNKVYGVMSELQHDRMPPPRQLGPDSAYSTETSTSMGLDLSRTRPTVRRGDPGFDVRSAQPCTIWMGSDHRPVDGWFSLRDPQERDAYRRPTFR